MAHLGGVKMNNPVANARATEQSILRRWIQKNKRQVRDAAPLSSSWCYYGVYQASTAQKDYWVGTLSLTTKQEQIRNGRVVGFKIGKTYQYHNFPLTAWSLMKAIRPNFLTLAGR
jgi:hypothetical protein